jgi:hypothetical protein
MLLRLFSTARLQALAESLPRLPLHRQVKAFHYLACHGHVAPEPLRQFEQAALPALHSLPPQQLLLLVRGYCQFRRFFGDPGQAQRALNAALMRQLPQLTQEAAVRAVLQYSQLLSRPSQELITQLLHSVSSASPESYSQPARVRVLLAAAESTHFHFPALLRGLGLALEGFGKYSEDPAVVCLGYLLYSGLIPRRLEETRLPRKAVY